MLNRLTNYENSNPENISCSNIKPFSATFNKLQVYNSDVKCPLQKFWFYLNDIKIFEKTERKIKIAIINDKFISYIDNLDTKINELLSNVTNRKLKHKKSYTKKNYFPHTFTLDSKDAIIYDEKSEKISIKNLDNYLYDDATVSILIELTDILIDDNENEYWINYSIKQMKINKNVLSESICDMCNICNSDNPMNKDTISNNNYSNNYNNINNSIPVPPPVPVLVTSEFSDIMKPSASKSSNSLKASNVSNHKSKDTSFVVSVNDITKQLEMMKKKKNDRINDYDNKMKQTIESINEEIKSFSIAKTKLDEQFNKIKLV